MIMDRFLVSPVRRGALIAAGVAQQTVVILIQTLVIIGVAFAVGARFSATAVVLMLVLSALLGAAICALSDGLALVARQEETLIGAVQFVALPATFLSSGLMASNPMPGWVADIARFNPVNWAVQGSRAAVSSGTDWSLVGTRTGFLAALLLVCAALGTRAFGAYQRSV
jgi:ABC-2 type transport system permease protein